MLIYSSSFTNTGKDIIFCFLVDLAFGFSFGSITFFGLPLFLVIACIFGLFSKASMSGISYQNTTTYSNYGVLGDEVGSGKSLTILAYIAALKNSSFTIDKKSVLLLRIN
jgi:hypothetical protein